MAAERITTIGPEGEVVIPADVLRSLGLAPRDKVAVSADGKVVRLRPVKSVAEATAGMIKAKRYFSDEEIRAAVAEDRAERAAQKLGKPLRPKS